jgi:hypothetical protein
MHETPESVRISRLADQGQEHDLEDTTAEERIAMMWQLAVDAWTFMGEPVEQRLSRHVVRVIRASSNSSKPLTNNQVRE